MSDTPSERSTPSGLDATDRRADPKPERSMSAAPSPEGRDPPSGENPTLSARDLQDNASQGRQEAAPGSDVDQANEVPHVG